MSSTAAILVIGNEILSGKVEETNARFLTRELRDLGVQLRRVVTVADEIDAIAEEASPLSQRFNHVFTSGGVGPTHDDVTMLGLAKGLGRPMVRHPLLERLIRSHFQDPGLERNLRMADVPEGTECLPVSGTEWPVLRLNNIYILPGVPQLFARKFSSIRERFRAPPFFLRTLLLEAEEGTIAELLEQTQTRWPAVDVGSYPQFGDGPPKVKITLEGKDQAAVEAATTHLLARLEKGALL